MMVTCSELVLTLAAAGASDQVPSLGKLASEFESRAESDSIDPEAETFSLRQVKSQPRALRSPDTSWAR